MSRQHTVRRCANMRAVPSAMLVLLLACTAFISTAQAAVLAVDLGSEFLKVSIVKPGRTPISIVLNEM
jgi:hypoxia up-regulated 1